MKRLALLSLVLALGGCGCGSPDDSSSVGASSVKPAASSTPNGQSDGVTTQVRKIGEVKKN